MDGRTDLLTVIGCWLKVRANPATWRGYEPLPPEPAVERKEEDRPASAKRRDSKLKGHWDLRLTRFQKLLFIKTFEEEKVGYFNCRHCLKNVS